MYHFISSIPKWLLIICVVLIKSALISAAGAVDAQELKTPKGLTFWLIEDATVPLITMKFSFKGGALLDPAGKEGLAKLLSATLDEGAGPLDSQAFQSRLQELAVKLSFRASKEYFSGTFRTLSEHQNAAFELLKLAINAPRFDQEPVERMKSQLAASLRYQLSDPSAIVAQVWFAHAYPDHPYARQVSGTLETLEALNSEDLRTIHARLLRKESLNITIVGDITPEAASSFVDHVFGDLPEKMAMTPVSQPKAPIADSIFIEHDSPQTVFRIGGESVLRDDPDFMTAYVVNHILGGRGLTSRLYQNVREKRGLTYSVSSYLSSFEKAGFFMISTNTRREQAQETQRLILQELKNIAENGPTETELRAAKDYLKGAFALRFDTSDKIASQFLYYQQMDLGIDYINKRNDLVEAVTLEDAKRVANRIFSNPVLVARVGAEADN